MLKPTHRKALVELLTSENFDTPEDMATALVSRLDALRSEDVTYSIVTEYAGSQPMYVGIGGFATKNQAMKFVEGGKVGIPGMGKKAIVPLYDRNRIQQRLDELDTYVPLREKVKGG